MKYKDLNFKNSWKNYLNSELSEDYMIELFSFLDEEKKKGKVIYPEVSDTFKAFDECSFDDVKVVILGQDPYHGEAQAHGLSFSVPKEIKLPPSLRNIYKEIEDDLGVKMSKNGNLLSWAQQGVLLLNSVLTVEKSMAASHQKKGWESFSDHVIQTLNDQKEGLVFVLWGGFAKKKGKSIERSKHLVLEGHHPSPLSAYRGFFGCKHFSKINSYLREQGQSEIDFIIK